jgi:hypothetical protein
MIKLRTAYLYKLLDIKRKRKIKNKVRKRLMYKMSDMMLNICQNKKEYSMKACNP